MEDEEDYPIDTPSKLFFVVLAFLIVGVFSVTYYKFIFSKNYSLEATAPCDPMQEACFVHVCDPVAEECSGDPQEDTSYYKGVRRIAKNIPLCDPSDESCDVFACPEGESGCSEVLCEESTMIEGEECNDPELYKASLESEESFDDVGDTEAVESTSDAEFKNEECTPQDASCASDVESDSEEISDVATQ